ncbi:inverse autotransporter beta domain-containing protein [Xenorhabdus sp. Sc-CR9]|uniref:inverse autotransporter beta domain-containing protein n=1 Tax=Xenorhabdus sp. Sc-CR9 TaxID=2584468 RepID=UPI001F43B357|nr:inverse autotransporter beta domain-containing protein [Xenorhabdus sp. Sc-CR9]
MNTKHDNPWLQNQQGLLKHVAWINIITPLAFPVIGAFTPAIATARTHTDFQKEKWVIPTEPYILKSGETVNTIAERYDLTVNDLKKINQLRTFNKPFSALGTGNEIDVPKPRNNKFLSFNYSELDKTSTTDDPPRHLAEISSRIGNLLSSDNVENNAVSQLRNLAVGEANQEIQDWLGHYGTARVQANVDSHGHLNGSQFDMLLPLSDTTSQISFTQFGLRRFNKRNTANLGVGQRYFFGGWMLGYNAFIDHDFTGENTRFGLGAEYARNYLKFGANGYFRLSNWKESRLLTDYDERPASGFDLRAQGYLPALPQLGGKLVYEQYFGDEVGLIDKDHRQKKPSAFTLGVNYTPVPLLTFDIDRRQDMSGDGETQFNMELNYVIGTSWSKQLDPDAVATQRTLQGSRYDLVDRNNQIVLEYRKREVISLAIENLVIGHAGETKPLNISINSKYGFKDIQWEAEKLRANGGEMKHQGGTHYLLTLPRYQSQGNNTYTVGAIAYDEQGNASKRVEIQVQVLPAEVNANKTTFTTKDKELAADGHSITILTLTLKNKDDKPISGVASDIKLITRQMSTEGQGKGTIPKIEKMKETQPGIYESQLTAGKKIGILRITPKLYGITINPVEIMFVRPNIPIIKDLAIFGKLEMGQKLSATYTFKANQGDTTDKSLYAWGNKGSTDLIKAHTVTESGKIPDYTLTREDAGTVKELAVQAHNGLGFIGNSQFIDTSMSAEQGNHTHDGGKVGTVRGLADAMTTSISADKVKKGESIILKIKTLNHGTIVRNVAVRVKAIKTLNRKEVSEKPTVLFNGQSGIYQDFTDNQGMLSIPVTDPNGLGVKTTFSISVDGTASPQTQDVIFTVATSPDVSAANFWGHMAKTVDGINGAKFTRPLLQVELINENPHLKGMTTYLENGEVWPRRIYAGANWYCNKTHATLPTRDDLLSLYQAHPANQIHDVYGWPEHRSYRSSTPGIDKDGKDGHFSVNIDDGTPHVITESVTDYVICKQ